MNALQPRQLAHLAALCVVAAGAMAAMSSRAEGAVSIAVLCGDTASLVKAVNSANAGGGGAITLSPQCSYSFTSLNNSRDGGNALPAISSPITIVGQGSTLSASGIAARAFDVIAGSLTLRRLTITNFSGTTQGGGAVYTHPGTTTIVDRVALVSNTAPASNGGAIRNNGTTNINDSLIYKNSAPTTGSVGGAVSNGQGTVNIVRSTIIYNSAGGRAGGIWAYAATKVLGSIVAGNSAPSNGDCGQPLVGADYVLAGDMSCGLTGPTNKQGLGTIFLSTPTNNGGQLSTMALKGSNSNPAAEAIPAGNAICSGSISDERGVPRPQGSACDIGSFELTPVQLSVEAADSYLYPGDLLWVDVDLPGAPNPALAPTGTVSMQQVGSSNGSTSSSVFNPGGPNHAYNIGLSSTSLDVGNHPVTLTYSGDSRYLSASATVYVNLGQPGHKDVGYQLSLPGGKGSVEATFTLPDLVSSSTGQFSIGVFKPYSADESTGPGDFGAWCTPDAARTGYVCSGSAAGGSITAAVGDTIHVFAQQNGQTATATLSDSTTNATLQATGQPTVSLQMGWFLPTDSTSGGAIVTFTGARIDGYGLSADADPLPTVYRNPDTWLVTPIKSDNSFVILADQAG